MEIQDLDGATNDQMCQIFKSSDRRHAVQSVLNLDESSDSEMQEVGDSPGEELLKRKKTLTMQSLQLGSLLKKQTKFVKDNFKA